MTAENKMFPSPFAPIYCEPVPLLELRLRRFSGEIKEKPRWWDKVRDPAIVARWWGEVVEHDRKMVDELWGGEKWYAVGDDEHPKHWPRDPITEAQLDYLFGELEYDAGQRDAKTGISGTAIPMICESSTLIAPSLKQTIRELAQELEDVPDELKDWHPGSNGQVLDLVHPSLYCLHIGKSFIYDLQPGHTDALARLGSKEYFQARPDLTEYCPSDFWGVDEVGRVPFEFTVSRTFQWLPADFAISDDGKVALKGYINNLNPVDHPASDATIASVLERFVPLFERVLSDELSPPRSSPFAIKPFSWYDHLEYPDHHTKDSPESKAWRRTHYWPRLPDISPFEPPSSDNRVNFNLRGRTIQVIVKMANIVLSPKNPTYPGGSWHVEGMCNEKIVATGTYYYDSANITESRLAFRAAVGDGASKDAMELEYAQNDEQGFRVVYGLASGAALNQPLGHVVAREDRCLAFPNVYQHRVTPFELADHSRPGHRKIIAFFLVDPLTTVHSTSCVPPHQARWYEEAVRSDQRLGILPPEILEHILGYVLKSTVTLDQAKADREELMKERAKFVINHNKEVFEAGFAMCEH
ncbi:hypothetical protein BD413DRAFT_540353 [Trametes elegans]|nr:hypothetical protein BD413DRAFT_540353 [Trametes elegans]